MSRKIENFNKSNLKELRAKINKALCDALEPLGLNSDLGNITFGSKDFHVKLTVIAGGVSKEALDFEKHAVSFGLQVSDLGKHFTNGNGTYQVCGLKPRSRKYPILAKLVGTEVEYKFRAASVAHHLAIQEAAEAESVG